MPSQSLSTPFFLPRGGNISFKGILIYSLGHSEKHFSLPRLQASSMRRHICLLFPTLLVMILVLSNSNDVLVECRALRSGGVRSRSSTGHGAAERGRMIIEKASVFAELKKMRDMVFVRYQMSTMASGPSRKGSGH